jgi:hypothetical protein
MPFKKEVLDRLRDVQEPDVLAAHPEKSKPDSQTDKPEQPKEETQ